MRNAIPPVKPFGTEWAEDNIESPFLYLPLAIAAGSTLATSGVPVVSNISGCPATFAVVDANNSADDNEGYFTPDHTNDNDYIWPGDAAYDANTHGLSQLGNFLEGAAGGIGGGRIMVAFTMYTVTGTSQYGSVLQFGSRQSAPGADGWFLTTATGNTLNFASVKDGAANAGAGALDVMSGSLATDNAVHKVALLIDANGAEIMSTFDGVPQTVSAKASIIQYGLDALTLANLKTSWTIGTWNNSNTAGSRSPILSPQGRLREMLIMDLSGYDNAQADFYELADRLYRTPTYSLPHWMDRF